MSARPRLIPIRRIDIHTGGGNAPGLNAVIRPATLAALRTGWISFYLRRWHVSKDGAWAVIDNADAERFEAQTASGLAFLTYAREDGRLFLLHTEVPEALKGRGLGSHLVQMVLEHAKRESLEVVPFCPFACAYLERHPEYGDLKRPLT